MNILYIGGGFVGACSASISADSGYETLVYDIDEEKVRKLNSGDRAIIESCLFEDGLGELIIRHKDRIHFTTDYRRVGSFLDTCDAVFMCLPTPEIGETGESNLDFYTTAASRLAKVLVARNNGAQKKYVVIVNKSTVPIDMVDQTAKIMEAAGVKNFGVVSNPEFLVEGKAIEGSIHPDRVVVGASSKMDFEIMRSVYNRFYSSSTVQYIEVNPREAAAGKLLANFYLFNKLAVCFDVVGRVCEAFSDVQFERIRNILTSESRIGNWGFYDSLYAGGSCFIKDARSLSYQLKHAGHDARLVDGTYEANKIQLQRFFRRAEEEAGFIWKGKVVALLGVAFKRDTNDIRNSPSIDFIQFAKGKGVKKVQIYDPVAMSIFQKEFPESPFIQYMDGESEAIKGADTVVIATDWPQFRGLADSIIKMNGSVQLIMDGRRILGHRYVDLQKVGCSIIAVGSPFLPSSKKKT